ncbi:hypothetical protein BD413DRAFT_541281, partial [Trametes elegans]
MHKSLRIAEIVSPILECFDTDELSPRIHSPALILRRDPSSIQTLANLTRTCRALQEPALDILWRDIPDISVLVKHLCYESSSTP